MSGHSHWSKIKRYKSATDAKRGRAWSKLARRIIVAAKHGGGNPDENLTLRYAIDDARAENMPNDTIDKAIKKGTGELGAANFETIVYEGYGPSGVAYMVECLTDNRARTAPELRKIFERGNGQLGATNAVGWMFEQKGVFTIEADKTTEDALMELALDAGADDVVLDGDMFEVTCPPAAYAAVKARLAEHKIPTSSSQIGMLPKNTVAIDTADKGAQILRLIDLLEENEDVQNVYTNYEMSDEVMEQAVNNA
ncbi:MAG: YebC/PmpR family DNA-binding transcriptional regulator [Planctomycetaceae bacterium]|nr:MAG: YebC/PmpR family DNA-binding transcriptional regulator [Planctomycetaceae bacterium]